MAVSRPALVQNHITFLFLTSQYVILPMVFVDSLDFFAQCSYLIAGILDEAHEAHAEALRANNHCQNAATPAADFCFGKQFAILPGTAWDFQINWAICKSQTRATQRQIHGSGLKWDIEFLAIHGLILFDGPEFCHVVGRSGYRGCMRASNRQSAKQCKTNIK